MCPFKINAQLVANELKKLTPEELEKTISEAIERTELFTWRHWHVARRFGAVERTADYKMNRARLLVDVYRGTPMNKETKREIFLEKLDVENAKRIVQQIIEGKIAVELSPQKGTSCSPFAMPIVDKIVPHDLLRPAVPTASLAEIVKERLLSHTLRLVCIFNADWEGIRSVKTLPERIRCPVCNSTLIAVTYQGDEKLLKISKKKMQKQQLTIEEQEAWSRGWKSASLVQTAGKKAVISMSGRGVGPTTAARILRKFVRNEQEFYTEILKAEREYARTRLFWD
jgi:ATP-dependent Lhr-like helicase